ncbi:MAG: CbtA family protein [Rhizobiales bacterium]|nr:CbtA family protein [Hyphomicrobiales bacterium]NRB15218.1 CbtA family protein [Hyphomicrobiales bacterium]
MFKHIVINALIVGAIAGAIWGVLQIFTTSPIILAAEVYELVEPEATDTHSHGDETVHSHADDDAWAPADGFERIIYTLITAMLSAVGFAMITLAFMALTNQTSLISGLLFGLAGYISFFVAPALGLLPEIPGTLAADLDMRQTWWALTVGLTAAGLATIAFSPVIYKIIGVGLLAIPHIIGAPQPEHHGFANTDPVAVAALTNLSADFVLMTGFSLLVLWLTIGLLSAYFGRKYLPSYYPKT